MLPKLFGLGLNLEETKDTVNISGVNGHALGDFITKVWKTSVLEKYMFKSITGGFRGRIEFYRFFTIDILYMLDTLSKQRNQRIPARTLNQIAEIIKTESWFKDTERPDIPGRLDFSRLKDFNYVPKEFQQRWLEYYDRVPTRYHLNGALLNGSPGSGKAVDVNTPARIPNGWKPIGELNIGDIVSTPDGGSAPVVGIFDHVDNPCYQITFADGRSCICDEDHLWTIQNGNRSKAVDSWHTVSMKELWQEYNIQKERQINKGIAENKAHIRLYVPLVSNERSCDKPANLPIDPYLLGVILGDGRIEKNGGVTISKPDEWIFGEVSNIVLDYNCGTNLRHRVDNCLVYRIRHRMGGGINYVSDVMRKLGLNGKRSWEKFIPEIYMKGSFEQRLALIQGLFDTDGCCNKPSFGRGGKKRGKQGTIEWTTVSEVMANQVLELLRSVGCIAKMTVRTPYYTYKGERLAGRLNYRIYIRSAKPSMLFRTPVKKDMACDEHQYAPNLKLRIANIQPVPSVPTRCIKVDHPDELFIIKDYIVTHNTTMSMFTMHCANVDRTIVVCPKNALHRVWTDDVNRMFKTPPKQWTSDRLDTPDKDTKLFVYHYEAIEKAIQHHAKDFGKYNYGLVLDESHNMNDVKSQRTQAWLSLCKLSGSNNIIHASGTPFKALGSESIPLLRAIDPMFTPKVEEAYKKIYGTSAQKGLDILRNRLGLVSFTVLKEELGLEKPIMNTLPIKIPDGNKYTLEAVREVMRKFIEERAKYYKAREQEDMAFYKLCLTTHEDKISGNRRMEAEFEYYKKCVRQIQQTTEYGMVSEQITFCKKYEFTVISASLPKDQVKAFRSVCSIIKYLPLKIQGECLGQVVGRMRIEAHVAMCKNIPFRNICESTKKKTVVFTSYVNVLEEAYEICKKQSLQPIAVYAKTNSNLASMVSDFEKKENVNPLIATYDSLSTAVPLTMADNMIMINAPFRAYIQEQAISRIHRLNQDSQTVVWQCYLDTGSETNISSRSLDIMQWSQQQVEAITGVKSPYTLEDAEDGNVKVATEGFVDDTLSYYISLKQDGCVSVENIDTENTNTSKRAWVWGA